MARNTKFTDKINNANFESNQNLTPEEQAQLNSFTGLGYYTRINLDDIINNFIVSHIGKDKVLTNVPRHEVAFWAQRGLQEFSYDMLHSQKNIEVELSPSLSLPLPADYVNYVKIVRVDNNGNDRTILPSRRSTAKQAHMQDGAYDRIYDENGDITEAGKSESTQRYQDPTITRTYDQAANDVDSLGSDIYSHYYSGSFGRRYGNEPQYENNNGTFQMDLDAGIIYFDSSFETGDIIGIRYISDGLCGNDDLDNVYVPKMAEDALYAFMLYNIAKLRPASAQIAPMYKKEASAKMRNAKIRLSNYKIEEIAQVMRGKAKWIKH